MKTEILAKHHTSISIIGFLLIVTTTSIGCGIFSHVNRAPGSDTVHLTQEDLYKMGFIKSDRMGIAPEAFQMPGPPFGVPIKKLSLIVAFEQRWQNDGLTIQYWLFDSSSTAKKTAVNSGIWFSAAVPNFQPERNPENVIGDATWRNIYRSRREWKKGITDIWFVKYNLLVSVRAGGHWSNRLQLARDTARKIEAEIERVLRKK